MESGSSKSESVCSVISSIPLICGASSSVPVRGPTMRVHRSGLCAVVCGNSIALLNLNETKLQQERWLALSAPRAPLQSRSARAHWSPATASSARGARLVAVDCAQNVCLFDVTMSCVGKSILTLSLAEIVAVLPLSMGAYASTYADALAAANVDTSDTRRASCLLGALRSDKAHGGSVTPAAMSGARGATRKRARDADADDAADVHTSLAQSLAQLDAHERYIVDVQLMFFAHNRNGSQTNGAAAAKDNDDDDDDDDEQCAYFNVRNDNERELLAIVLPREVRFYELIVGDEGNYALEFFAMLRVPPQPSGASADVRFTCARALSNVKEDTRGVRTLLLGTSSGAIYQTRVEYDERVQEADYALYASELHILRGANGNSGSGTLAAVVSLECARLVGRAPHYTVAVQRGTRVDALVVDAESARCVSAAHTPPGALHGSAVALTWLNARTLAVLTAANRLLLLEVQSGGAAAAATTATLRIRSCTQFHGRTPLGIANGPLGAALLVHVRTLAKLDNHVILFTADEPAAGVRSLAASSGGDGGGDARNALHSESPLCLWDTQFALRFSELWPQWALALCKIGVELQVDEWSTCVRDAAAAGDVRGALRAMCAGERVRHCFSQLLRTLRPTQLQALPEFTAFARRFRHANAVRYTACSLVRFRAMASSELVHVSHLRKDELYSLILFALHFARLTDKRSVRDERLWLLRYFAEAPFADAMPSSTRTALATIIDKIEKNESVASTVSEALNELPTERCDVCGEEARQDSATVAATDDNGDSSHSHSPLHFVCKQGHASLRCARTFLPMRANDSNGHCDLCDTYAIRCTELVADEARELSWPRAFRWLPSERCAICDVDLKSTSVCFTQKKNKEQWQE